MKVPKVLSSACEIQDLSGGKGREWAGPTVLRPGPGAAWTHSSVGRGWRGCSEGLGSAACCKHGLESVPEGFLHQYLLTNIPETHWKSQVTQPRLLALYSGVLYSSMHYLLLLACLGF